MIFAYTGQPGSGKTLGAIEFVYTDKQFFNRPVYVYNVKGLNVEGWTEIDKEQVLKWWELPDGSVLIIDECQDIWRPRGQGKAVPEHVEKLEKHRHRGFDFVLTFQFPTQIDTVVRNLITDHYHSHRAMGLDARTIFKWDYLCIDPLSKTKQKSAVVTTKTFNKKIYDLYESASLHTAKKRIPKFVYFFPLALLVLISLIYFVYDTGVKPMVDRGFGDEVETDHQQNEIIKASGVFNPSQKQPNTLYTAEEYIKQRVPLVKNDPWSAPIYSGLLEARTLPKSYCIKSNVYRSGRNMCRCYTQQSTWDRSIDNEQCNYFIENGYKFDYTLEDRSSEYQRSDNEQPSAPFDLIPETEQKAGIPSPRPSTMRHPAL